MLLVSSSVQAQGLAVYSHSGCTLSRNGAGVADPCKDGSAVFYNPAAIAMQPGAASLGLLALFTGSEFTFNETRAAFDSDQGTQLAPHAWLSARLGKRLAAGIGVLAPYGLVTQWPLSFEGRFIGYDNSLRGIYIQPTLAGELIPGRLALGAGIDIVRSTVEIRRRVDLATTLIPGTSTPFSAIGVPRGTDFADAHLDVDDWSTTFHIGLQYLATDHWAFGARYLHTAKLDLNGTAGFTQVATGILLPAGNPLGLPAGTPLDLVLAPQFAGTGTLSNQLLSTQLTLPNQFVAGARYIATDDLNIFLDYQWTGWSHFDQAALNFQRAPGDTLLLDFRNTSTVRLGADWTASRQFAVRGGLVYSDAASPNVTVTPLLIEGQRITATGGLGYQINERFAADAGIELVFQEDRPGSVRPRESRSQPARELLVGQFRGSAVVLGLTMSYRLSADRGTAANR